MRDGDQVIRLQNHLAVRHTQVEYLAVSEGALGTHLGEDGKIGTFVETKNAKIGPGAKVPHLSYVGDAEIGEGSNIGAGTIFANYDGKLKHKSVVGERAFIGSNSALIAPIKIGADAIVAAGSAVSRDVGDGELRMVRAEQLVKPGWADRFHDAALSRPAVIAPRSFFSRYFCFEVEWSLSPNISLT